MKRIKLLFLLTLIMNFSCSKSNSELDKSLTDFSTKIAGIKLAELKKITTEKGFKSLLDWSDSLKNDQFLNILSKNLKNGGNEVFNKNDLDSLVILSLGKSDVIVGATNGYLILKKTDEGFKIDGFRGGK